MNFTNPFEAYLRKRFYPNLGTEELEGITPEFRIEGYARDASNVDNLSMRTADPLWMLGRQWQFGEFTAEDNGSPVQVKPVYRTAKPTAIRSAVSGMNGKMIELSSDIPLEVMVEAVPLPPTDLRSRVRIGQYFESLVRRTFPTSEAEDQIKRLRTAFPLQSKENMDEKSARYFKLMKDRVTDGNSLLNSIDPVAEIFESPSLTSLNPLIGALLRWHNNLFFTPDEATQFWNAKKLVHQFDLQFGPENNNADVSLHAPDYRSGHLDWYSFDRIKTSGNIVTHINATTGSVLTPVLTSFPGMPKQRLFEFEDGQINLHRMHVDGPDMLRLLLLDLALVCGGDWFTVPLELEIGSLCWIEKLEVMDYFGVTTIIRNDGNTGTVLNRNSNEVWDVFKIRESDNNPTAYNPSQHCLYLAPATSFRKESPPIEEVRFVRDEGANMAWGIEKVVRNDLGKSVDGFDLHLELNGPFKSVHENPTDLPQFRLATSIPTNWIPYFPTPIQEVNGSPEVQIALERGSVLKDISTMDTIISPLTSLAREDLQVVREEALPRTGVAVQLTKQRVRWIDGRTYVWVGRQVMVSKILDKSELRFDHISHK
ncbi:hypothetical protein [Neolewinella sp.]|uniref:hypothetical protein n=1 Tax=Neolewinella sp. TaxID=2993543 RepID=UPI003B516647